MKPIAKIAELGEKCFGCGACAAACPSSCIEMREDETGFIHPVIDAERCLRCNLCDRTCPAINLRKKDEVVSCCGAVAQDRAELARSSSGGVFGMLARNVLEQGGAVVGAAFDNDLTVRHVLIDSIGDCPVCSLPNTCRASLIVGFTLRYGRRLTSIDAYYFPAPHAKLPVCVVF